MSDGDDELCIPRSAMYKLVKELVPQVRLSSEAKDLIVTACNEFIHLLASEANNVCEKQSKKLILPDHVLLALDNLGFGEYKDDCVEVMKQMQEEVDKRKKLRNRLDKPGIPEEELLRQQNELFAQARKEQQMNESASGDWTRVQEEAAVALKRQASAMTSPTSSASVSSAATFEPANNPGQASSSEPQNNQTFSIFGEQRSLSLNSQLSFTSRPRHDDEDDNYD